MLLTFGEKELQTVFEVSEENKLYLLHVGAHPFQGAPEDKKKKYYPAVELQITGRNQDDHHGVKHTVTSGSQDLIYKKHTYYQNEKGNKLEFVLENDCVRVTLHYQFYQGLACLRSWSTVENISQEVVGLEYLSTFTYTGIEGIGHPSTDLSLYTPHNSWVREVVWRKQTLTELGFDKITPFSTKKISLSNTGTWSTKEYLPMGALENSREGRVYLWQIEHNGSWQWEISDIADRLYLKLSGPNEVENHWYKGLKPGETFTSVKGAVAVASTFDDALAQLTRYRRQIVRINEADKHLPVIFNDYMNCLWADPTTEKMKPVIDMAKDVGAEYYCMDAGWYADGTWWETVGEWMPCEWRFPGGIKEVFDYIKSKDMIPGIWLEIEVMGINCPLAKEFSDDCFFMRHGKRIIDHGRYQLDFRNPKVRAYATSVIDRVVKDYGVGYIKMDYNIEGGIGTELNADSVGDGLLEHNRALLSWAEEIMDTYPHLVIENCGSGGMRMDYATMSLYPIQSVSDQEDYRNTAVIAANCATAILPEQGAIWSYPLAKGDEHEASFNMVNAMLCRMHLSGEIYNLSPRQLGHVKEGVACYKSLRHTINTSVPRYPLGLNANFKDWACVVYESDEGAYMSVWRLSGEEDTLVIPYTAKEIRVVYPQDTSAKGEIVSDGIRVCIPNQQQAVIFRCK